MKDGLYLRPVTTTDVDKLFQWANDPVVRASAYSTSAFDYGTHVNWFEKKLKDSNCCIYLLTDGRTDFGQVRGDLDGDRLEIDYSIAASYRGQGLAKEMLKLFEDKARGKILYAEVKKENTASKRVFEELKYNKEEKADIYIFRKKAQ